MKRALALELEAVESVETVEVPLQIVLRRLVGVFQLAGSTSDIDYCKRMLETLNEVVGMAEERLDAGVEGDGFHRKATN